MRIDLSKLFEQDGSVLEESFPIEAEKFVFQKETYDIVRKSDVSLLIKHSSKRQIEVSGKAELSLMMSCSRCLDDVIVPFELDIFAEIDMNTGKDGEDELPYVSGYSLDVDLLVFDELIVNMPISVLCNEDCKGLCLKCGTNLNRGRCDCDTTVLDPRMARILDIFNANNKEV